MKWRLFWTFYFNVLIVGVSAPGSVDSTFTVVVDGRVTGLLLQPDGRILMCGAFTNVNGVRSLGIVRLNDDYTVDTSFQTLLNGDVLTALLHTNGQIVINGRFTQVNGAAKTKWARLNPDGSLDATFNVPQNHQLQGRPVLQSDGKIIFWSSEKSASP